MFGTTEVDLDEVPLQPMIHKSDKDTPNVKIPDGYQVWIQGGLGAWAPLTTNNEAPAPKFYKIEAPKWQF